jgi:hypothetical protein
VTRILCALFFVSFLASVGMSGEALNGASLTPHVTQVIKFAETPPLRTMKIIPPRHDLFLGLDLREQGDVPFDNGYHGGGSGLQTAIVPQTMPNPIVTFEGPSNANNQSIFGFQVSPPDPVGEVGRQHYLAMVNLTFAIYFKASGTLVFGPADIGTLWQGFPINDCTDASGDPIVFYDQVANRWVLTQFTTRGPNYYNCMAVSKTADPLGAYNLYAFTTGQSFPDYPKYGMWTNSYTITTREFDLFGGESIGIYAVNRQQILQGNPNPTVVSFNLSSPTYLVGDGLLAADFDGRTKPPAGSPQYILGTMDDGYTDGAPFDGINVFQLKVNWANPPSSTFGLTHQLAIINFDTVFPCSPSGSRNCIRQPGTTRRLDILSYRQRPTWRVQYRNFGDHESLVANQSVEALPGVAGVRWWEIRSPLNPVLFQDGTWAPADRVNRWMGSIAMDKQGNMAAGYSASSSSVFPSIRYAGRLITDALNQFAQGEAVLQAGNGSQLDSGSRWGDYTSMNVDPADDCTFYYINEYYTSTSAIGWQTRIGSFKYPGCL